MQSESYLSHLGTRSHLVLVNGTSLPLSGLFAIDKPSGIVTMKLLNSINELLASSKLFMPLSEEKILTDKKGGNQKRRKRGFNRAGRVKLGQGGTLDPLASGVLGRQQT